MGLMPFSEARERALARVTRISETEKTTLATALGRVLAAPIIAPENVPNHDNTAMDGYAVRFQDLAETGDTHLQVVAIVQAGGRMSETLGKSQAARIFTGAPIPDGCDCIVIQENATRDGDTLIVPAGEAQFRWIRPAGQDITKGAEVFGKGHILTPPDIGMLASLGHSDVRVVRRLKVAIVSTGNEVTAPGAPLAPGQIYDSNRHSMMAALQALGAEVLDLGIIRDDRDSIAAALQKGADQADAIVTSGGVSEGDYDHVKDVLQEIGVVDFWKVRMKPGKPQAHGTIGKAMFFGLPGNPVSVLATFLLLVRPAMQVMMGAEPGPQKRMVLPYRGAPISKKHDRVEFARGLVTYAGDDTFVSSTGSQNSGVLTSMSKANAFIFLDEAPCEITDGDLVTIIPIEY